MYPRSLKPVIVKHLSYFPAVILLGPRQCGKTTLAKHIMVHYPDALYLDLESPADQRKLTDPELFLNSHIGRLIVFDEIQHKQDLFPVLRSFIDRTNRKSPVLLLGSASQALLRQGGETLAGRIALSELSPLTLMEVSDKSIQEQWFRGGFPGSITAPDDELSMHWREYFIRTFIERDLPQLGLQIALPSLQRLLLLLAHHHGTLLNVSKVGGLFGVSHTQMRSYLDFLAGSFLLRILLPYGPNIGKQLVKTPKLYFRDSGILHTVLSISTFNDLLGSTICGESWEGFVIEQLLSSISSSWQASFYRTRAGAEIDILLIKGSRRIAVECKMHTAPTVSRGFWSSIEELMIPPEDAWIVCPIDEVYPFKNGIQIGGVRQLIHHVNAIA